MPLFQIAKMTTFALLILPALIGCATKNTYRLNLAPVVTESQFAVIQNFGTAEIDPSGVDALLREVADMLGVNLDHSVRKVRIVVTSPENIAGLALAINSTPSGKVSAMALGRYVEALYLPKVSVAMIPYFDRVILGHELAHYVTDHYLKHTPLAQWEAIADRVEHKLWVTKPARPSPALPLPSVAQVQDTREAQNVQSMEDETGWSQSVASVGHEAPGGDSVGLLQQSLVARDGGVSPGEVEARAPVAVEAHTVDEFAAVVALPLAEADEHTRAGETDPSVPAPAQPPGVDEFAAVAAVPFKEPEGQGSADDADGRAGALLVHASQWL